MHTNDTRRENGRSRSSKCESVKHVVGNILRKRNHSTIKTRNINKEELLEHSLLENGISRPNSIIYCCYNSDPFIIDSNFSRFLAWMRDLTTNKKKNLDLLQLVAPLFIHLYLACLRSGHPERASFFFRIYFSQIEKLNCCIDTVLGFVPSENDLKASKTYLERKKIIVTLARSSLNELYTFVSRSCHAVFLQVIHAHFQLKIVEDVRTAEYDSDSEEDGEDKDLQYDEVMAEPHTFRLDEYSENSEYKKLLNILEEFEHTQQRRMCFFVDISNAKTEVNCALMSRSQGVIIYNQESVVHIVPLDSEEFTDIEMSERQLHQQATKVTALTLSNKYLVSGANDGNVVIYKNQTFDLVRLCKGHTAPVFCVKIGTNEIHLASGSADSTVRLWDLPTGKMLRIIVGHNDSVTCLDFHPNCLYLATGSSDKSVRIVNIVNSSTVRILCGTKGMVSAVTYQPDGNVIATAGEDKKVRIWDILTGVVILKLEVHDASVTKLLWSTNGRYLCGASSNPDLIFWDYVNAMENTENKNHEPYSTLHPEGRILDLEYNSDSFGCIATTDSE